mgnify:CR=1 FL=1
MNDNQHLKSAKTRFSNPIPTYDDGWGPLFIHRDSMGISGIVRAQTWEDAYSICEDEFFPEANETLDEIRAEYNFTRRHAKIIRPKDGSPEREATLNDFPLEPGQFVRWDTITTPAEDFAENDLFQEAFGFRPSGPNVKDTHKHGIYSKDLNGDALEMLTPELIAELEISLEIETDPEEPEA